MTQSAGDDAVQAQRQSMRARMEAWTQRAQDCAALGSVEVAQAARVIVAAYEKLLESGESEPPDLVQANKLRKRIEAAEAHRTMSAEHGLSNEAIDVTYEIRELESELVALIQQWQQ